FRHAYDGREFAFLERRDRSHTPRGKPFAGNRWARRRQHAAAEFRFCHWLACVEYDCSTPLSASRMGVCYCLRTCTGCFLAGLSPRSALSRTGNGGDRLPESWHDPLYFVLDLRRFMIVVARIYHCEGMSLKEDQWTERLSFANTKKAGA